MAKAKRGRKKKQEPKGMSIDLAVVTMIIMSILLGVLIYTQSGYVGKMLSPMLGRSYWNNKIYNSNRNICNSNIFSI